MTEPRISEGTLRAADGRFLPLEKTAVKASVRGPLAQVEVRQSFCNPTEQTLEATYLFPLPHQASVYRMEFRLDDRVVKAVVKEKEEARRVYEKARSEGRAATLLEQERPNLFTLSVANIAPGARIEVLLEYQEPVAYDFGEWRFSFPMVASERYGSATRGPEGSDGAKISPPRPRSTERQSPLTLEFQLFAEAGQAPPYSPSHQVRVENAGEGFQVTLEPEEVPNRDFILVWPCHNRGLLPQVWYERSLDKPGTFALTIPAPVVPSAPEATEVDGFVCGNCGAPMGSKEAVTEVAGLGHAWQCDYCGVYQRVNEDKSPPSGKDVVFLVDLSASVGSLKAALEVVEACLLKLAPSDQFRLVCFHHELVNHTPEWRPCDAAERVHAVQFLRGQKVKGGTEIELALRAGGGKSRDGRPRVTVLITDGAVGNEGRLLRELPKWLGDSRLYVMGVGNAPNRYLIDKMAQVGRGAYEVSQGGEAHLVERFAQRVAQARPVLSSLVAEITGAQGQGMDVYPREGRELFSGQILRLTGRFVGAGPATLRLSGKRSDGSRFLQEIALDLPEYSQQAPGIERVWARLRIEELQDQLMRHPERLSEIRLETLGLALKHHLMSPYTALVADDEQVSVDPEESYRQVDAAEPAAAAPEPVVAASESLPGGGGVLSRAGRAAPPLSARFRREGLSVKSILGDAKPMLGKRPVMGGADEHVCASVAPEPPTSYESYAEEEVFCTAEALFDEVAPGDEAVDFAESDPLGALVGDASASADLDYGESLFGDSPEKGDSSPAEFDDFDLFAPDPVELEPPAVAKDRSRREARRTPAPIHQQTPVVAPEPVRKNYYSPEELRRARDLVSGQLDLVFLIDETGSMGPYINEVQERLLELIKALGRSPLCSQLRLGLVTFRDHPPQDRSFVTRVLPLTSDVSKISHAVGRMRADGGGDGPEAVTDGLHELLNLDWSPESARLVVMVGDAPPHGVEPHSDGFPDGCPCGRHWYTQAEGAREMGLTIHTVGCQGIQSFVGAEAVFQTVAKVTGGLYVPLNEAWLLIELVTGLADRELDRQRLRAYVEQLFEQHRTALEAADFEEQVRFLTETLQQQGTEVLDLLDGPGRPASLRPLDSQDVALALEAVRRRVPVPA